MAADEDNVNIWSGVVQMIVDEAGAASDEDLRGLVQELGKRGAVAANPRASAFFFMVAAYVNHERLKRFKTEV